MKDQLVAKKNSILAPMLNFNLEERRLLAFCLLYYNPMPNADNSNVVVTVTPDAIRETFPDLEKKKPAYILNRFEIACNSLQTKPYVDPADPLEKKYWFDKIRALEDGGFQFTLTKSIEPYFLNLSSHFIRYSLKDVAHFKKPNSWNLYEYAKEKFLDGISCEWVVAVETLKERLGVSEKYIGRFNKFDESCLKAPVSEINDVSDIKITYTKIKKGVSVVKIRFIVEKKKWQNVDTFDGETSYDRIKNGLLSAGLQLSNINKWIADANKNDMLAHLEKDLGRILLLSKQQGVKNPRGYVTKSVQAIANGVRQMSFEDVPSTHAKHTVEACYKDRGPNCSYLKDRLLDPLYTICNECREKH